MIQTPNPLILPDQLRRDGFTFVTGDVMRSRLGADALTDWQAFAASWNDLAPDTYLAARGRHRRRRHAVFASDAADDIHREPHQPHYQSLTYNALQGDIQRWFEPIATPIGDGASMRRILAFCHQLFGTLSPNTKRWHIEVHQFRIEARAGEAGEPTPEGVHRDGVDYVLVLLVDRVNIESGTTTIHAHDGTQLGSFTLTHALDAALVDDARVCHGVTAVTPLDPALPAYRDVLVVTFKASA
ncbi:2OG-Fe dioxygenase family protein [Rhodanobacter sp. L36]|uniref:2OG-Fe dioxygenase family protein n=1 Tax=Rhodanobacter sp. L36 TaxID=1747221 RepID=UPI00131C7E3C|nr:2OG-Fe dioxygenase family protein [Rhodanobacter sp. L36]